MSPDLNCSIRRSTRRDVTAVQVPCVVFGAAILACCAPVFAQQTWVVDVMGGPGSQFTQIQPAIDAASVGDLLVVRPGSSSFYNGFTLSKGVTILCEVRSSGVRITTDIIVRGVPSGQGANLKRLTGIYTSAIILEDNAGQVVLEKCRPGFQGGYVRVRNSAQVAINEVYSGELTIEGSLVTMNRGLWGADFAQDPLLTASDSIVVFGNSILEGSRANYNGANCRLVYPPGVAIGGHDSVLVLGAGTSVTGGHLAVSGLNCPPISIQAAAITGTHMTVFRDPGATLGQVDPGVTVITQRQPTLDGIVGDEVQGRMDFDLIGTAGSVGALIASAPGDAVGSPYGIQWADLGAYLIADVAAIGPTGHHRVSFAMPAAYPYGQPMVFQSIVLDAGALIWSTPSWIVRN